MIRSLPSCTASAGRSRRGPTSAPWTSGPLGEPVKVGTEGWRGGVAREFDPNKENVVTTVSFGPSLPRALAVAGVPVACVGGALGDFGFLPALPGKPTKPHP